MPQPKPGADGLLARGALPGARHRRVLGAGVVIDMDQRALGYWTKWTVA
jgi:hypothetical protein